MWLYFRFHLSLQVPHPGEESQEQDNKLLSCVETALCQLRKVYRAKMSNAHKRAMAKLEKPFEEPEVEEVQPATILTLENILKS